MSAAFAALGRFTVRYRWAIVVVWIVGTGFAARSLPSLSSQVNDDNTTFLPASAPSNQAARLATPLVGSSRQAQVPVVAQSSTGPLDAAGKASVAAASSRLAGVPTVLGVTLLGVSPDGAAAQLLVRSSVNPFDQPKVTDLVNKLGSALAGVRAPPGLSFHLAGQLATDVANQKQSKSTGSRIQGFSILFIVVLLLFIFRSLLAPLVTLLPAAVVLSLAGSLIGGLGEAGLKISSITQLLLIVLVLGAGTDYGLFLVFRVREELHLGRGPHDAVAHALARVGESISASAGTVIVALLSLLFASFGIYHDLGPPLAIGIAVMLLAGLTLLPALLAILGRAVFWPYRVRKGPAREGLWGRVAHRLLQRPAVTLAIGVVAFGALAAAATAYRPGGFGGATSAPSGSDAAAGNAAVAAHFPQSSANPTNLVFRLSSPAWSGPGVLEAIAGDLRATRSFRTLQGPLDPNGSTLTPEQLVGLHEHLGPAASLAPLPPPGTDAATYNAYRATARFISADGLTVQYEANLAAGAASSTAALHAVPGIRTQVSEVGHEVGAVQTGVAGEAPGLYDVSATSGSDLHHIVPIAVLAIAVVLALVLRSLVAPLYLIASVVLSYLAALGVAVIVFIGIAGDGGITFLLPFLMFIFLLALGEDYNILVMTRIREEAADSDLRSAVVRAVGATGPTVTSAGLVLAGSFAVLAIAAGSSPGSDQVRAIGFGLAIGILMDTFLVRTLLVPSTVALLGRWNWWPGRLGPRARVVAPAADRSVVAGDG